MSGARLSRPGGRRATVAAASVVLVVLTVAGCGRVAERLDHRGGVPLVPTTSAPSATSGASPAAPSPADGEAREDGPTPTPAVPDPAAVTELQQALDAANELADQVDKDMASDDS